MFDAQLILIVEDEPSISIGLADAVSDLAGMVIGPLATVREALDVLDRESIVGAILDGNLLDRDITPVAVRLLNAGIPFVLHTGSGPPEAIAADWPDLPIVMKPASPRAVAQRLAEEMRKRERRES